MILGLGNDVIIVSRIGNSIARFGERFITRIFTDTERMRSDRRRNRVASYAKRFAAKEACAKALGTGFRRGVYWRDIGVVNARSGKPTIELRGGALRRLREITPRGMRAVIDLTMTDERDIAEAVVIISAVSDDTGHLGDGA
jgi:holo-[acyl-carrier protein] synthase